MQSVRRHMKFLRLSAKSCLIAAAFACSVFGASAQSTEPTVPAREGRVTDLAHILKPKERAVVVSSLAIYEKETSHQIVVLTVPTLDGERMETFSLRTARAWRIGRADYNNGILITLALKEGAIRIELGRGFEKYISNAEAKSIVQDTMVPQLAKRKYYAALHQGLDRLMGLARRYVAPPVLQ